MGLDPAGSKCARQLLCPSGARGGVEEALQRRRGYGVWWEGFLPLGGRLSCVGFGTFRGTDVTAGGARRGFSGVLPEGKYFFVGS